MEIDHKADRLNAFVRRKRGGIITGDNPRGLERVNRQNKDGLFLGKSPRRRNKKYLVQDMGRGVNRVVLVRGIVNKLWKVGEPFEHLTLNWVEK